MKIKEMGLKLIIALMIFTAGNVTTQAQLKVNKLGAKAKASVGLNGKSKKVFDENKENFKDCYSFLMKYSNYDNKKAYDNVKEAQEKLALAKTTMANLENGIPEGFEEFQKTNDDAKKLSFVAKAGYTKKYMAKTEEKIDLAKKTEIATIEKRVGWIERAQDVQTAEKYYKDMTIKLANLEDAFPGDEEVKTLKKNSYARAKAVLGDKVKENEKIVAGYRMPENKYNLGDKANVNKQMTTLFENKFKSKVIKITIPNTKWETRYEEVLVNNKITKKTYGVIKAFIAYKEDGKCYVHEINFRKDGSTIDFYGFVDRKEIKEENI